MSGRPATAAGRLRGFSLIELLVVVSLIVLVMGMALAIPRGDKRAAAVMEAARELAQTMRQARAMAIEDQAPVAITFNLQNAPGTDGSVLNNWTGGHWYQVVRSFEMVGGSDSGKYNGYHGLPQGCLLYTSDAADE